MPKSSSAYVFSNKGTTQKIPKIVIVIKKFLIELY